jgi:hypothetical protein
MRLGGRIDVALVRGGCRRAMAGRVVRRGLAGEQPPKYCGDRQPVKVTTLHGTFLPDQKR